MAVRISGSGNRLSCLACFMAVSLFASSGIRAEDDVASADKWQFEITPYLFAASLKASPGVGGVTADVDLSFNDIVSHLDFYGAALFEARHGPWIFALDSLYVRMKDEKATYRSGPVGLVGANADLNMQLTEQIHQPFIGYRLTDGKVRLDVIGGARYTNVNIDLALTTSTTAPLLPGGERNVSTTKSWWDPIVGVRANLPIAEKWSLFGYADVGVGDNTTYQYVAGARWQISHMVSMSLGYRYLLQNHDSGNFHWNDAVTQGAILGVGIRW